MSTPIATAVTINSLTSALVTFSDGSTKSFGPNPVLDLAANKTVPIEMLHTAMQAYFAAQYQTATASTNAAHEPNYTQISALLARGTTEDIMAAKTIADTALIPAKQKKIAAAQAKLAQAQQELAALQPTPATN